MGWTYYDADTGFDGKVDVKHELDRLYKWNTDTKAVRVLKSSIVNGIYYAAVEVVIDSKRNVTCAVCKTDVSGRTGMNFGYKPMDESMIPCYYDCPKTILKLLTPTENKYANEWRRLCNLPKANSLPVGTRIKFTFQGKETVIQKRNPAHQFKTSWWLVLDDGHYFPKRLIPREFKIVEE